MSRLPPSDERAVGRTAQLSQRSCVLLTGATCFIGSALQQRIISEGLHDLTVAVRRAIDVPAAVWRAIDVPAAVCCGMVIVAHKWTTYGLVCGARGGWCDRSL